MEQGGATVSRAGLVLLSQRVVVQALLDPSYAVAGTGYYSCSDKTYWTIMIG